jgi:hypothetical protein
MSKCESDVWWNGLGHGLTSTCSGNEDNFQAASYQAYRWSMFSTALKKEFPDIELLATTLPSTALNPKYTKSASSCLLRS